MDKYTTIIHTAKGNYSGADLIDISADSRRQTPAGKCFAPTALLAKEWKQGIIETGLFEAQYIRLIRERYAANQAPFLWLLVAPELTLICNAHKPGECHCHLAAEILAKIAAAHGVACEYRGERPESAEHVRIIDRPEGWPVMPSGATF